MGCRELRWRWPCSKTTRAAIVADVRNVIHHYRFAVDVGDRHDADIVDGAVIEECAVTPIAALIANAVIAEAVVHAAIETDVRPPIADVEDIDAVIPTPLGGRPQQAGRRRRHPRPWRTQ